MFSAFRCLSVFNAMVLEYFMNGWTATRRDAFTLLILITGSFLAGLGDQTFDRIDYVLDARTLL
jgi:hypothetical protein